MLEHIYPDRAAKACGLTESIVAEWMRQPAFKRELDILRREAANNLMRSLEKIAHKAVNALSELVESKSEQTRLKAADCILEKVIPYGEHFNLREQMAELKELATKVRADCAPSTQCS